MGEKLIKAGPVRRLVKLTIGAPPPAEPAGEVTFGDDRSLLLKSEKRKKAK